MRRSLFLLCGVVWWAFHIQPLYGQNAAPVQVTIRLPVPVEGRLIEEVRLALAKAIADVPIVPQGQPRVLKGEIVIPRVDAANLVVKGKDNPWHDSDSEDGGRVLDRNEQGAVIQAQGGPAEANPDDFVTLDELAGALSEAIAHDGTAEGALLSRALLHATERRVEPALADADRLVALHPRQTEYLLYRSVLYQDLDRLDDAERDLKRVIELEPNSIHALARRSRCLASRGNLDGAIRDLDACLRIDAKCHQALRRRADLKAQLNLLDAALADANAALEVAPQNVASRMQRALLLLHLKQFERSQADIDELLTLDPDSVSLLRLRAYCWHSRRDVDKAIADYTRVLELEPSDVDSLVNRGKLYQGHRQYSQAIDDLGAAVKTDRSCIAAYRNLANIWASCPDKDYRNGEAAVGAAKALVARPNAEPLDYVLSAAAYAECGKFEDAVKHQEQALAAKQGDPQFQAGETARLDLYRARKPYHEPLPMNSVLR